MSLYNVGDKSTLRAEFRDQDETLVDPSTVAVVIKPPTGPVVTLYHGVDIAVVRDSLGAYHYDLSLTASGVWHYRWEATGTIEAADERPLRVRPTAFP